MTARVLLALFPLLPLAGCFKTGPKTQDDVYQEMVQQFDDLAAVLVKVYDGSSGRDRLDQIKQIGARLRELKALKDQFDRNAPSTQTEQMRKKYDGQLSGTIGRVVAQRDRLRRLPTGVKEVPDEVQAILQSLEIKVR